jgi:hypothetical protein
MGNLTTHSDKPQNAALAAVAPHYPARVHGLIEILCFPETVLSNRSPQLKNYADKQSSLPLKCLAPCIEQFQNPVNIVNATTPRAPTSALQRGP